MKMCKRMLSWGNQNQILSADRNGSEPQICRRLRGKDKVKASGRKSVKQLAGSAGVAEAAKANYEATAKVLKEVWPEVLEK